MRGKKREKERASLGLVIPLCQFFRGELALMVWRHDRDPSLVEKPASHEGLVSKFQELVDLFFGPVVWGVHDCLPGGGRGPVLVVP